MTKEDKINSLMAKLSMLLLSNSKIKMEIHKQGDSIIWKHEICEEDFLENVDKQSA